MKHHAMVNDERRAAWRLYAETNEAALQQSAYAERRALNHTPRCVQILYRIIDSIGVTKISDAPNSRSCSMMSQKRSAGRAA